ncbi:hypothetical protein F5Y12DRAFT_800867 [Xylaria sp. FL1777]|nr:hypothetical protein F5Y12DRAFT_800867 [Xylaria sp. FL1777]
MATVCYRAQQKAAHSVSAGDGYVSGGNEQKGSRLQNQTIHIRGLTNFQLMSLGVKSLWRAQSRIGLVQGLSLVPREFRNVPTGSTPQARCRFSSTAEFLFPKGELETSAVREDEPRRYPARKTPLRVAWGNTTSISSLTYPPAARGRRFLRRMVKKQVLSSRATPMIKPAIPYPSPRLSRRSLRKHVHSMRRQAFHEYTRSALNKIPNDWRSTLDFMLRHTPKFGDVLDFKIGIGKAAAAEARATLSGLDTNLWQIQQRHHCKIRIETGYNEDEPLVLSLSGTTVSVRESLLELVRTLGRVSAVRVLDAALQVSSPEFWRGSVQGQSPIQLLGDDEVAAEDETLTVYGQNNDFVHMARRPKHRLYKLTRRADEITRPTVWTKSSFEQYVAQLVFARVPTHLHRSLYPVGLDHQETVVSLLTSLFSSEDLRASTSVAALKMALQFIHSRGSGFRPAARTIFYQAELQRLPLDAEVFRSFLISAVRDGDLQGFNSTLRAMHKKGHYMRAETWTGFLTMIQNPRIKSYIMRRMRSRGLHRVPSILAEIGRQKVMLDLQRHLDSKMNIPRLLHSQDSLYGPAWLNTLTLNRMIEGLGSREDLEACHELLDLVDRGRRVRADHYTLNTMITHTRSIPQKIALLSRWQGLGPDDVTYRQLFQAAWRQRLPNMLRVIWRYGVFANLTGSQMRHTLTILMRPELVVSKNRTLLKEWEDVILGRAELAAGRAESSVPNLAKPFGAVQLMSMYRKDAGIRRPLVPLGTKLQEAYDMDMRIHKLIKEGVEMSSAMRESLTIDIPLGVEQTGKHSASNEALSSDLDSGAQISI